MPKDTMRKIRQTHHMHKDTMRKIEQTHPMHKDTMRKIGQTHPMHKDTMRKIQQTHPMHKDTMRKIRQTHPMHKDTMRKNSISRCIWNHEEDIILWLTSFPLDHFSLETTAQRRQPLDTTRTLYPLSLFCDCRPLSRLSSCAHCVPGNWGGRGTWVYRINHFLTNSHARTHARTHTHTLSYNEWISAF